MSIFVLTMAILLALSQYGTLAVEMFPFDVEEDTRFYFNDDEFTSYTFKAPFNFFNNTYGSVFISGNGQVSFGQGISQFTPACSPSSIPMIMAFWADADNSRDQNNAKLLFRESTNRGLLSKAGRDISKAFPDFNGITLSWMFIVTWKDLPFNGATSSSSCDGISKRNTFQLILASDGIHSFALMYYDKIEWTTGIHERSGGNCLGLGGTPAKAGFDYGNGETLYTVPGSCDNSILNITHTSNIDEPGKWVFRIDSKLRTAECQEFEGSNQKLKISPFTISPYGNIPLRIEGPCVTPTDSVTCMYNDESITTEVVGIVGPDSKYVVCPLPAFNLIGRKTVTLKVHKVHQQFLNTTQVQMQTGINDGEDQQKSFVGHIYVVNGYGLSLGEEVTVAFNESFKDNTTLIINVEWDPVFMEREIKLMQGAIGDNDQQQRRRRRSIRTELIDLSLELYDGQSWRKFGEIKNQILNTGSFEGTIDKNLVEGIINLERPELITVSVSRSFGKKWNKVFSNTLSTFKSFYESSKRFATSGFEDGNHLTCKAWSYLSDAPPKDTRPCPPTRQLAEIDGNFEKDAASQWMDYFHPGGNFSVRQKVPSRSGAGSQCVYDANGVIMVGPPGGGTLDRYSPVNAPFKHFFHDVLPFVTCCKLSGPGNRLNCERDYYKKRPSDDGKNYTVPMRARAVGDPHITTFDGLTYTFNGVGEFWMVKMEDSTENLTFTTQARMEQYVSSAGVPMNASIFTAIVMKEVKDGNGVTVQVAYTGEKILVFLDGEAIDNDSVKLDNQNIILLHKTSQISIESTEAATVTFSSGYSFTFSTIGPNEGGLNIIGMVTDYGRQIAVEGLMGNCDGKQENDFKTPEGLILPVNSSLRDIHYNFGLHWMVKENESIFSYLPGKGYNDYSKPDFQPNFEVDISNLPQNIIDTCSDSKDCIFDYVTTGSLAVANMTKVRDTEYVQVLEIASTKVQLCPSILHPENGFASLTNLLIGGTLEFFCDPGYVMEGDAVSCTCISGHEEPYWNCNGKNPFRIKCVSTMHSNHAPKVVNPVWVIMILTFFVLLMCC